jgi:hypothetical protein
MPIAKVIAFEKENTFVVKLGEKGPQNYLWTAVAKAAA